MSCPIDLECVQDCDGRECGPDPRCGLSCGTCRDGWRCNESGACTRACVTDEDCDSGRVCHLDVCCKPDCENKQCGDDGCGGICGDCPDGETCQAGQCVDACSPCAGDPDCDDDGQYCNGEERCDLDAECCEHSGNPCEAEGQTCNEAKDSCE